MAITLFEKFFHLHDSQKLLYQSEKVYYFITLQGPGFDKPLQFMYSDLVSKKNYNIMKKLHINAMFDIKTNNYKLSCKVLL